MRLVVPIQKGDDNGVLIFPIATYYRDGPRKFTREDALELVRNFDENILERRNGWLPVNSEHERARGRVAYITDLWAADDGVRAELKPAPGHEQDLNDFDYISPEIKWNWTHPYTGKKYRNVLVGAGLTNYPYLLGRTAVHSVRVWTAKGEWEPIGIEQLSDTDLMYLYTELVED